MKTYNCRELGGDESSWVEVEDWDFEFAACTFAQDHLVPYDESDTKEYVVEVLSPSGKLSRWDVWTEYKAQCYATLVKEMADG